MSERFWLAGCGVVILMWGCSGDKAMAPEADLPYPTTIMVSPAVAELAKVGDSVQLTADVQDRCKAGDGGVAISWTSSDIGIATVGASGLVQESLRAWQRLRRVLVAGVGWRRSP